MTFSRRNKSFYQKIILFSTLLFFFIFFTCLSLWRFNIGQVFYYDFGHYSRILWLISRFVNPVIDHKVLGEIHFMGDHFSPSLYFISPLFWISNKLQILLVEQVLATIIAGIIVYTIAHKEKLSFIYAYIITIVFFLFAGLENPLVTDWHTESTALVFLLLFIYLFFYAKKQFLAFICAFIYLGFKDNNALSLIFILIPFFLRSTFNRNKIIIIAVFCLIWFIIVGYVLTPLIAKQPYLYSPVLPTNPLTYFTNFFNLPIKQSLIINSMGSFAFMPILSGFFLIPIFAELGIRLIPNYMHSQSFSLGMHYNVFLASFLALATIQTFKYITNKYRSKKYNIGLLLLIFFFLFSVLFAKKITHPPILMALNPTFWKQWNKKSELFNQLKYIPRTGSIMSQNNILPHLIARTEKVYLLSLSYKKIRPQYIVFDLSTGQNINNYYSGEINSFEQVILLKEELLKDKMYSRIKTQYKDLFFFQKASPN